MIWCCMIFLILCMIVLWFLNDFSKCVFYFFWKFIVFYVFFMIFVFFYDFLWLFYDFFCYLETFSVNLIRKKIACLPPQQDCYLLSAMHVMPFRPCPKLYSKMVKAENRARPAVIFFLLNKAPRRGKNVFLKVLKKSPAQRDFFLFTYLQHHWKTR